MEAREHFIGGSYYGYGAAGEFPQKPADQFVVDDLLDLPSEDLANMNDGFYDGSNVVGNSSDSSNFTVIDSCNSSVSGGGDNTFFAASRSFNESTFSTELCVPNDDVAELEWLSTFVEDSLSFSNNQNLQHQYSLVSGTKPPTPDTARPGTGTGPAGSQVHFLPETPLPSKSRSRRSRAAPCDWTTRLLHLSSKPPKAVPDLEDGQSPDQAARRCLHCAAEKTPQWRTGPMGPKTLCNACGVRYKSGRLVPEYRPAASPTFVSAKHSNSHRKVVELRRQKEMQRVAQQHQQILCHRSIVGLSNGYDDVLINHSGGSSYSHLISGSAPL